MSSYTAVLFSLLLISSVVLISSLENSFADEIIATSTGLENSTILELKNSRGNSVSIDSVRIWVGEENEFKSFKTEKDWLGMKELNGVIEFKSEKMINPGESVKFGIKTMQQNPTIYWKALDSNENVINSGSTKISNPTGTNNQAELNVPKIVSINDSSNFRFIPEKPSSNSDFRVVGDSFIPNQTLDFYIGDEYQKTIQIDSDGKILFTATTPNIVNDERTEFILRDKGGTEKILSLRVQESEKRELAEIIKLSIGNTPKEVKRGDTITLNGMATPTSTITITAKEQDGNIVNIDTVQVSSDGTWKFDNLFSPILDLGVVSIEINDGKSKLLRNFDLISAEVINISSKDTMYEAGDTVLFEGYALPNQKLSLSLEDGVGTEIYSQNISVGNDGFIEFGIDIPKGSIEGTYILYLDQGKESGITAFGVGQEPRSIIVLRTEKLNFDASQDIEISIQGEPNSQIALIIIDSADREKLSDSINLGPDGREIYTIPAGELGNGAYILNAQRGESAFQIRFTVGLTTGSGPITLQTTKTDYNPGEQILILGNTQTPSVLLDISIAEPNGNIVKTYETFSDKSGVFKIDNFRIPIDGEKGKWLVNAKSGSNFKTTEFSVVGLEGILTIILDKDIYNSEEFMTISGTGSRESSTITMKIFDPAGEKFDQLNITAKNNGEYITLWQIPKDATSGIYLITVNDGKSDTTTSFIIN